MGRGPAKAFLEELKANEVRIASSNGEVKRLVVAGEVAFGLTDTDDANEALKAGAPLAVVYPDQEDLGALVMPTSVVLIRDGPNPDEGRRLVDRLLSAETERRMGEAAAHVPLRKGVPTPARVKPLSEIHAMEVDLDWDWAGAEAECQRATELNAQALPCAMNGPKQMNGPFRPTNGPPWPMNGLPGSGMVGWDRESRSRGASLDVPIRERKGLLISVC